MMRIRSFLARAVPALAVGLLVLPTALAQDEAGPSADDREEAAALVELAEPMLWRGSYLEAVKQLKDAALADPTNERAFGPKR